MTKITVSFNIGKDEYYVHTEGPLAVKEIKDAVSKIKTGEKNES